MTTEITPVDLLRINVNDKTEKKNGLTYLSWAWAWAEALKADPKAVFNVEMFNGKCFMEINGTAMVWVTVTMFGKPMTCQLPVMDYRNKAITNPDCFAINTAIMRCMTKALSLHGLGLYIYSGEDTPEEVVDTSNQKAVVTVVSKDQSAQVDLEAPTSTNKEGASDALFAEMMVEYTNLCDDVSQLNGYWKANQQQVDALKVSNPELYAQVRNGFAEVKKQLKEKSDGQN
jgi:general stress protein 26